MRQADTKDQLLASAILAAARESGVTLVRTKITDRASYSAELTLAIALNNIKAASKRSRKAPK